MTKTDPNLTQIAAQFTRFDIEPNRGGWMKLMLESAHEIVENDPMFCVPRRR
jgi:hypothetical protein